MNTLSPKMTENGEFDLEKAEMVVFAPFALENH